MSEGSAVPEKRYLGAIDYVIFIGMLVITIAIGIFFAFINKKKPNTPSEFLTGSKELSVFPIAMSISSSQLSGLLLLITPVEVYMYGSQITLMVLPAVLSLVIMLYAFMPVFYNLNFLSSYEYLKKRFNYRIAMLASILYLIKTLLYSAAAMYATTITLSQLSGLKIGISIPILTVVCMFYTSIGGLRAVVWVDTLQAILMLIGSFALAILGTYHVGGFNTLWERNENSERIEFFNMDPDPRTRATFWTVSIGFLFLGLSESTGNQMMVQRCLSLSTFKKIQITLLILALFSVAIVGVNCFNGLVAFATFYDCDPVTTKTVSRADQLIPYLWMVLTRGLPALPGLFVSALFSATLSTISTHLNCMAGVFVIDIVKPLSKRPITEAKATLLMKIMVIIFGCLLLGFSFAIDNLRGLFQIVMGFLSIVNGPIFGMFVLGMFCPRVGAKAVFIAALVGFSFISWIFIGTQIAISQNQIITPMKNFSIEGCDNSTLDVYHSRLNQANSNFTIDRTGPFPLYAISYHYYTLIGAFVTFIVGLIASYLPGGKDERRSNMNLYSPIVRKWIRTKREEAEEMRLNNTD